MLSTLRDINQAAEAGRFHQQRFLKNSQGGVDGVWYDWSYISGQPAYDARIGDALSLTPFVAERNDGIWFPPVPAGMTRHLAGVEVCSTRSGDNSVALNHVLYDLVAAYPLIDGDSTDQQDMDNTAVLPRYADGRGLSLVFVNHVAPQLAACDGTLMYIDGAGAEQTIDFRLVLGSVGRVISSVHRSGGSGAAGAIAVPLANGTGIRRIVSVTFTSAPGGLISAYLVRMLPGLTSFNDVSAQSIQPVREKCFCVSNGYSLPVILDGAWLGFFVLGTGGSRGWTMFGQLTFVWG